MTNRAFWRSGVPSCGTPQTRAAQPMCPVVYRHDTFRAVEEAAHETKSTEPRNGRASTTQAACYAVFQRCACLGKRRRRRRRGESRKASEQKRRPIQGTHTDGRRGFEGNEFEEFGVAHFLQKFKVLFGLLLCLFTLRDGGAQSAGVLAIEGCLNCLGHRGAYGA